MTGGARIAASAVALLAAAAPASHAEEWAAHLAGQSPAPGVLESGELAPVWLKVQNTGTGTWEPGVVDLATVTPGASPAARPSALTADAWRDAATPAQLQQPIAPGQVASFGFDLRAAAPGTYDEFFAVRHGNGAWMGASEGWHVPVTVVAAEAPHVEFTQAPAKITEGEGANVTVRATDNVGVVSVEFSLESEHLKVTTEPWSATLHPRDLESGRYAIRAVARDRAGHETVVESPFEFVHVADGPLGGDPDPGGRSVDVPRIRPKLTVGAAMSGNRLRVTRAHVSRVPAGARVVLRYGRIRQTLTARGLTVPLRKLRNRRLDPRTPVEVTVTKGGMTGAVLRYTVARRPTPRRMWGRRLHLCLPEGAKVPRRCAG